MFFWVPLGMTSVRGRVGYIWNSLDKLGRVHTRMVIIAVLEFDCVMAKLDDIRASEDLRHDFRALKLCCLSPFSRLPQTK